MVLYLRQFGQAMGRGTAKSLFIRRVDTIAPLSLPFSWTIPEILATVKICSACLYFLSSAASFPPSVSPT